MNLMKILGRAYDSQARKDEFPGNVAPNELCLKLELGYKVFLASETAVDFHELVIGDAA